MDDISFNSLVNFLFIIPLFIVLLWGWVRKKTKSAVAMTDLEYLRTKHYIPGKGRKITGLILWALVALLLGILWSYPVLYSAEPVFGQSEQLSHKNLIIAIDISRSMGQPLEIPDREARFAMFVDGTSTESSGETQVKLSRYELARETMVNFMRRFEGSRFGLILFSTEPFLARWPTADTSFRFMEIMEEKIGPNQRSQLQRFSALTNIDEALKLARNVLSEQKIAGQAIVLISDAEDEMETMSLAIRSLRTEGIRLYVIGVGISEFIVDKFSEEFPGDSGFRIFRVDSDAEMEVAYNLVSELEESFVYANEQNQFSADLRWLLALFLFVISIVIIWSTETLFHHSLISDNYH